MSYFTLDQLGNSGTLRIATDLYTSVAPGIITLCNFSKSTIDATLVLSDTLHAEWQMHNSEYSFDFLRTLRTNHSKMGRMSVQNEIGYSDPTNKKVVVKQIQSGYAVLLPYISSVDAPRLDRHRSYITTAHGTSVNVNDMIVVSHSRLS